jgi:hypothetical protein
MVYLVSSRGRWECHAADAAMPTRERASQPLPAFPQVMLAHLEAPCAPARAQVDIFARVNILSETVHSVRRGRYGPIPPAYK